MVPHSLVRLVKLNTRITHAFYICFFVFHSSQCVLNKHIETLLSCCYPLPAFRFFFQVNVFFIVHLESVELQDDFTQHFSCGNIAISPPLALSQIHHSSLDRYTYDNPHPYNFCFLIPSSHKALNCSSLQ